MNGCAKCGTEQEVLKSVYTTILPIYIPEPKRKLTTGNFALCDECFKEVNSYGSK